MFAAALWNVARRKNALQRATIIFVLWYKSIAHMEKIFAREDDGEKLIARFHAYIAENKNK